MLAIMRADIFSARSAISVQRGFTLLELIITIIIVGVLAVVAGSRLQNTSDFDTFALQGKIVSSLRHMQFRAMQDTREGYCHQLVFDTASPAVGPPSNDYSATSAAAATTCATAVGSDIPDYLHIQTPEFNELGATLTATDGTSSISFINFNSLGQPITAVGNCVADCQITVTAQSSSSVCVNSEGFIRGC